MNLTKDFDSLLTQPNFLQQQHFEITEILKEPNFIANLIQTSN